MLWLFRNDRYYETIAQDFVRDFDSRFRLGVAKHVAYIHTALTQFGKFNDDVTETLLSQPKIVESLFVALLAENCTAWANAISSKTERRFVEAVVGEGKRIYPKLLSDASEFYFMFRECKSDPLNTRVRIACFALSKLGSVTQSMMNHLASDPVAQLVVQGSLIEDGIAGILADMKAGKRV
ncbi:hypothetical protein [Mesorhizobium sp. M0030]|uniref:hypothetical protein n=1 Tax=Mesorhizobium sp. M0030 TaxID=2956851 RepID=UPI003339555B